jgi:tetratricopeptide (TPR) repeat protein
MAHAFRFGDPPTQAGVAEDLTRSPEHLALAARGAMAFDLPRAQARLGAALAATGATPERRASGHVGRGVALLALGRVREGLRSLDSATLLFSDPREARLQAAPPRVVPPALGVPGWTEREIAPGRAALRAMAVDPALRARAAWALAVDAYARADTVEAGRQRAALRSAGAHAGLTAMLTGLAHAAHGNWSEALAASEPALAFDSAGHAPDPFLRAALHVRRGDWLARLGRAAEADRSWLWYESLDLRGWPQAEAQPAEVDWAVSTAVRARRARLALERGDLTPGCTFARRASELWTDAEPRLAAAVRALADAARGCPP